MAITYGTDLHLFVNNGTDASPIWANIAFTTSHTIKRSVDTRDISSRDSGDNEEFEYGKKSFEISVEALVANDANNGYETLVDYYNNNKKITVVSGIYKTDGTLDTAKTYERGTCMITSIDLSAGKGENVTYSASLKGTGALTKVSSGAAYSVSSLEYFLLTATSASFRYELSGTGMTAVGIEASADGLTGWATVGTDDIATPFATSQIVTVAAGTKYYRVKVTNGTTPVYSSVVKIVI